jgi:O-antigen/teichoic acid export membrane protein
LRVAIRSIPDAARSTNPLPPGTAAVGVGLIANGISTYGSLVVARQVLDDEAYSAFAVLWGLLLILGPGLFQPLEQEIARATSHRAVHGEGSRPVLRKAAVIGGVQVILVAALAVAVWPAGLDELLHGRVSLLASLLLGLAGYMTSELVRGVLGGRRRFRAYGASLGAEGGARVAGVAALAIAGATAPGSYAVVASLSFAVGAAAGLIGPRPFADAGEDATWAEITPALGLLLIMSLSEAFLLNVGPAAVGALSDSDADAGRFLNALVIARLPLFLYQAVKIALLPSLATLAGAGDIVGVRRVLHRLLVAVASLVVIGVAGAATIGPQVVELMFGDEVGARDMVLLAAANGGSMIATTLGVALVSLGRSRSSAIAWLLGVAAFSCVLALDLGAFVRIELALVVAFALSSGAMWLALRPALAPTVMRPAGRALTPE